MERLRQGAGIVIALCAGLLCGNAVASSTHGERQLPVPVSGIHPFHCGATACAMPDDGAYPYLIIGHFQTTASAAQSRRLFTAMRGHHHWQNLPDSASKFHTALQPVAIRMADGSTLAVLMTREETRAARPQPGDLVRYSPHRGEHEIPPTDPDARAWWSVDGCVAVLCRAGDSVCFGRYPVGVYRPSDGVAISPRTLRPLASHTDINPDTLLPVSASGK